MSNDFVQEDSPLVLVVDDDKSMRMLLRLALEQEGYQVVEANNGEACLAAYRHYQPDAVLLDAVMPVMDGFACCTQLQTLFGNDSPSGDRSSCYLATYRGASRTPILMITVLDDPDSVERAFEVGATDYITKPIHWAVLRHRVRRLIQESQKTRAFESLLQQLDQAHLELERLTSELARYQETSLH
ncbi:MAG: response regulator [Aphanothece sp. CMT-3BRIN-NPC111]|jgi:PleD family two-component response regulator|nr:response regulator [Aphanothece sp. CMT-3BRIN-NPC111]